MLIGRGAETAVLDRVLEGARAGRSGALVLRGEAGVGKSALLDYAREQADGFTVLTAAGVEVEAELAYAALHQLLRPAFERIEQLPEPQAVALRAAFGLSDETVEERFHVSLGVLGLLAEAAEERPLLCLVDDAQWLDQASADALVFVARRLGEESLALLFSARDDAERTFGERSIPELRLAPLGREDSQALLAERFGTDMAAVVVDWVAANANGIPLALMELPASLTAEQLTGKAALLGTVPRPTSIEEVFLERVSRLPDGTRQLLLLAAAEETDGLATIQRAAAGLDLDVGDLSAAETAGLLSITPGRVVFRHPLVRSAIYRGATFAERERTHRALAESLSAPADADRRAWHLAAATVGRDEDVAAQLERTADRARARSGYAAAAAALERAAELTPADDVRGQRLVAAATASWRAGRPDRANALLEQARPDVTDRAVQADLEHLRGEIEMRCGVMVEACDILMAGAEAIAEQDPAKALQMLLEAREAAGWAGDTPRTVAADRRAVELPRGDDPARNFLGDLVVGVGQLYEGDSAVGTKLVEDVIRRADDFDVPVWLSWAAAGARALGDEDREAALMQRALSLARASGAVDTLTYILLNSALMAVFAGRFEGADLAAEGVTLAREAGLPNAQSTHQAMLAWFAGARGGDEACRTNAQEAIAASRPRGAGAASSIAEWALGLLDLGNGRPDEAFSHLATAASPEIGVGHPYFALLSAPDLVEAAVRSGRPSEAAAAAAGFAAFAQPGAPAWARALAARCRAISSEGEEAEEHFASALDLHAPTDRRFDSARTELLYGEFLRRERRRLEARKHLRQALEVFEQMDAGSWAERAGGELRATGETARKRDPGTLAQLTPQELQIARLVAEGRSNKDVAAQLFLSPRTIDYHLRKVFMKLGIASRAELIRDGVVGEPQPAVAS
jgi:DNA-binding CsgD family transcriptional regulator